MCGIAGILDLNGEAVSDPAIRRMTSAIAHRGPDGEGIYIDGPVALGHRRLAIIDLSPAAAQPMTGDRGKVVLTFGGEIFNFRELRVELQALGHRFTSSSDSEVIVHGYEEWGVDCVHRFNGQFAFAIWDGDLRRLFLARDKYGVKPLYWTVAGDRFLFGSEVKAILAHPGVRRDMDLLALNEYMTFQNVYSDRTLFSGVRLLPPGSRMVVCVDGDRHPVPETWWDFETRPDDAPRSEEEAVERLTHLFRQGVRRQLVSDVPVGCYLSGGIDSGSVVAVASSDIPRLMTFTGGFDLSSASGLELGFDERDTAEYLANLFKTEHYEVVLHAGDMQWVLPELIWHLEDLRVGQSYPNYYVARLASHFVKVVLSGAGGDELFGGYPWRYFQAIGPPGRDAYLRRYYEFWQRLVPDGSKGDLFRASVTREVAGHSTFDVFESTFAGYDAPFDTPEHQVSASLYFELKTFLHGLLVVEDKLSLAHSLETRVPFLDDDLVEFAMCLPAAMKLKNLSSSNAADENEAGQRKRIESQSSEGKPLLRSAMSQILPAEVANRAKQGFSAPDASWFRGESIDYINRLLNRRDARIYEFLQPTYVSKVLEEHTSGKVNRRLLIWSFLSLEWWCRVFLDGEVPSERPSPGLLAGRDVA